HHLLLGDTLMLTPLFKKLRTRYADGDIAMTVPDAIAPLYATKPYGVRALPFDPRRPPDALFDEAAFDLALVPGDNRYAWLAAAMRARDLVAQLIDGEPPAPFRTDEWHGPPFDDFGVPDAPYAVLHVGASSPLKRWLPERWRAIARNLEERGIGPVWFAG